MLAPPPQVTPLGEITLKVSSVYPVPRKNGFELCARSKIPQKHRPVSQIQTSKSLKNWKNSKKSKNHAPAGSEPGPTPISGPYLFKPQPPQARLTVFLGENAESGQLRISTALSDLPLAFARPSLYSARRQAPPPAPYLDRRRQQARLMPRYHQGWEISRRSLHTRWWLGRKSFSQFPEDAARWFPVLPCNVCKSSWACD